MFKYLTQGLLAGLAIKLLDNCRYLSVQVLKIEAAQCYLHGVRTVRSLAIGLMRMGLMIGLIVVGALLFHAGLFLLLPWTVEVKAVLGMFLGLAYVAIGWVALHVAMNEKAWMERSGAAEMMEEAVGPSKKDSHG